MVYHYAKVFGIAVVVLKICEFQYYASSALKCLFTNDVNHRPNPQKDVLGLNHVI